jgi:transcriptional regulator with XRE-family HTH domain
VTPPILPPVPFATLRAEDQARAIGWNLRLARKRAGLTLPALARHMRDTAPDEALSLSYLGDVERGDRSPSLTTVLALARALDVDPRSLFRLPQDGKRLDEIDEADAA